MIGRTRSFLQFTSRSDFTYSLKDINLLWFCMLSLFIVIARLLPLLSLKHTTVVKVKQERSRSSNKPFWQRFYLDFMLVIPTGYAYWRLRHQLSQLKILTVKIPNNTQTQYDPLQFIASSLFIIAACMVVLRVFPLFLRILRSVIDRGIPGGAISSSSRSSPASSSALQCNVIDHDLNQYRYLFHLYGENSQSMDN